MERLAILRSTERNFIALLIVAALAACGSGGGGSLPSAIAPGNPGTGGSAPGGGSTPGGGGTTGSSSATQQVTLSITIPKKATTSLGRSPLYIPSNTGSMIMTLLSVNGTAAPSPTPQGPFNLTPGAGNPNCTTGANGTTCTFKIAAPVGSDIFVANTFASSNASGQSLGSGSILLSVQQNATNTANLSLTGPVATVQVVSAVTSLTNGNQPVINNDSVTRAPTTSAKRRAAASAATSGTRRPAGSSATPPPIPNVTTSRIFVIALDAQGNQIINPTTFDIPIMLQLGLGGLPANSATLAVTYAGLPGEPAAPSSTSIDGGKITVDAPSDVVTFGVSGITGPNSFSPTVVAEYTPQGGTAQTSTPLTFSVELPPPVAFLTTSATHVDPFTVGVPGNLNMTIGNAGTAATSGTTTLYVELPSGSTYNGDAGTDPSVTCSYAFGEVTCNTNTAIAVNQSIAVVVNVTLVVGSPQTYDATAYYGNAVNSSYGADASDSITVNNVATPALALSLADSGNGTLFATVPGAYAATLMNAGTAATSGAITLTDTLPTGAVFQNASGAGWICSNIGQAVTCTYAPSLASNAVTTLTLNVTPSQAIVDTHISNVATTSGGGSAPASATATTYISSPIVFSATGFNVGLQYGNAFAPGDLAVLDFGSLTPPTQHGSVSIIAKNGFTGHNYTLVNDTCTSGNFIDGTFDGQLGSVMANGTTPATFNMNFVGASPSPACNITVQDTSGNQAQLSITVESIPITVQGKRRQQ